MANKTHFTSEEPLLVQVAEPREIEVTPKADEGSVGRVVKATIVLDGGRSYVSRSAPDVPMRTDVLDQGSEHAGGDAARSQRSS